MRRQRHVRGFTLIEVMITLGIVALIVSASLINFRGADSRAAVIVGSEQLAGDVRLAAFKALNRDRFQGQASAGWGLHFNDSEPRTYTIFADIDGDHAYDLREKYKTVNLNSEVVIGWQGYLLGDLVFEAGNATPYAAGVGINTDDGDLVLTLRDDINGLIRSISINPLGVVDTQ